MVAVGCLLLGGAAVQSNLQDYRNFDLGLKQLQTFVTVLDAANAISAERGPANAAMAAAPDQLEETKAALALKREATDAAITRMQSALDNRYSGDTGVAVETTQVTATLNTGRVMVDEVVSIPLDDRSTRHVPNAIMAMFRAADTAATLRNEVSGHLVSRTPQIAGEVLLASAASALREQAGRLGSYVVMTLVAPLDEDADYELLMDKTGAIVRNIWDSGLNNAGPFTGSAEISDIVARVEKEYLGNAMPLAMRTAYTMGPTNGISGGEFTAQYVPGMASLEALRSEIVTLSLDMLEKRRDQARGAIFNFAILSSLVILVLISVAVTFRRYLFTPLLDVHQQVVALASGNLTAPARSEDLAREVNDIYQGLAILRENQLEKQHLEEKQHQLNQRLKHLSETDMLTGLLNRRALVNRVDILFRRAGINGEDMAVVLFDIDHFKQVNDTYGHAVGDEVLAGVALRMDELTRQGDAFARIGGEEFVIILRRVDHAQALRIVHELRAQLHMEAVHGPLQLKVTASFGVAMRLADSGESWDDIFRRADQHLYAAKHAGRDRIVSDSPDTAQRIA